MSKKFFSFIHEGKLHIAPDTKVISGEAFSSLIDAQEVLKKVRDDAEQYKVEIASECEQIKENAQKEGFEHGFSQWADKVAELEDQIIRVRQDMENLIVPIALKASKKIVGRELDVSKTTVVDIIVNSLRAVAQHKKINIKVNRKDFEIVEKHRQQLKDVFENLESLSIRPQDDVDPGGCVIETEGGIINAQLENQWLILENAFQRLMKQQRSLPKEQEETEEQEKEKR